MAASSQASLRVRFESEAALVESFVCALERGTTCYGAVQVTREWDHRAGLVDVLARDCADTLVAFEAKLDNWRRAFMQAYRSTAYADRTYVLLPPAVAVRAMDEREEFERRGVGLCAYDGKAVQVLIEAAEQLPLLQWIKDRAHQHFNSLPDERKRRARSGARRSGAMQPGRA